MRCQSRLFFSNAFHREGDARRSVHRGGVHVLLRQLLCVQYLAEFIQNLFCVLSSYFVSEAPRLQGQAPLQLSQHGQGYENDSGGEDSGYVQATAGGHTYSCRHEQRGGSRKAGNGSSSMQDGTGSDEADAGNNLRRYPRVIASKSLC